MCIIPFLGWGLENKKRSSRQAHRGCGLGAKQLHSIWESPDSTPDTTHKGKNKTKQGVPRTGFPLPFPPLSLTQCFFTHLDFPLSLAPPRFPVSPGLHYLMLTYIQGPSGRNKVCSQFLSWSLNSKGYFLFSLNLNLSPPESEVKSFSGRVPTDR